MDECRDAYGVEPICGVLPIVPPACYAAKQRRPSARSRRDAELVEKTRGAWEKSCRRYGARRIWRQLKREGVSIACCTLERLMRAEGFAGIAHGKKVFTAVPHETAPRADDLVPGDFSAPAPNRLWVTDLTYVRTWAGFVYMSFVIDASSRFIVGWQSSQPPAYRSRP